MYADGGVRHAACAAAHYATGQAFGVSADSCQCHITDAVKVSGGGGHRSPSELQVLLRGDFRGVTGGGLDDDSGVEHTPEIHNAEQEDQEHRQDQGELHQGLAAAGMLGGLFGAGLVDVTIRHGGHNVGWSPGGSDQADGPLIASRFPYGRTGTLVPVRAHDHRLRSRSVTMRTAHPGSSGGRVGSGADLCPRTLGRGPCRRPYARPDRLGAMTERVLVVPRAGVPGGTDFTGIRRMPDGGLEELRTAVGRHGTYLDRPLAEDDPSFKQLIPYVIVRDGDAVFLMHRTDAGGDPRLHGKASIGVGGHLNPVDEGEDALMAGLRREWSEELVAEWEPEFRLLGLLNDDSNPVGSVHLGVVFEVDAAGRRVDVREHDKLTGDFADADMLAASWDRLETWSRLVAGALDLVPAVAGSS